MCGLPCQGVCLILWKPNDTGGHASTLPESPCPRSLCHWRGSVGGGWGEQRLAGTHQHPLPLGN